jgi:hypothetical protein
MCLVANETDISLGRIRIRVLGLSGIAASGAGGCRQSRTTVPASSATTGENASADPPPITK